MSVNLAHRGGAGKRYLAVVAVEVRQGPAAQMVRKPMSHRDYTPPRPVYFHLAILHVTVL